MSPEGESFPGFSSARGYDIWRTLPLRICLQSMLIFRSHSESSHAGTRGGGP